MDEFAVWDYRQIIPIEFGEKSNYINDIDNILFADTGRLDALESNKFFQEAGQMLVNAVNLFELGYFDCAFYSLRQALEVSVGTLYLTANKDKVKEWNKQERGFEGGRMFQFLKENEPTFKDVQDKMKDYFAKIRETKLFIDKYVHKQGYRTFYSVRKTFQGQKTFQAKHLLTDFERCLSDCIGAVAVYRLVLDPMPLLLMDKDIDRKTMPMMAEPFSKEFIDKYIGAEYIELYKGTVIYQEYYNYFNKLETQNDAVYNIIHYQFVNRNDFTEIESQVHLLSIYERIAVGLFSMSNKISNLYLMNGTNWYFSDVKSKQKSRPTTLGSGFYQDFFKSENNYNESFYDVSISRCWINNEWNYIEHNELLDYNEITGIQEFANIMNEQINKLNQSITSFTL